MGEDGCYCSDRERRGSLRYSDEVNKRTLSVTPAEKADKRSPNFFLVEIGLLPT